MSTSAHSIPPAVEVDAVGPDRDIAVIVLDLEEGGIARSMVRTLAKSGGGLWLSGVASYPIGSWEHEEFIDRILARVRGSQVFRPELTYDAACVLRQRLDAALDVAESECRRDGCTSIGLLGGLCAAHDEAADVRRGA